MIRTIKKLINLVKSEINWHLRTSDVPKAFKAIRSYIATKETWDAKMSEHLRIRIIEEPDSASEKTSHDCKNE